MKTSVKNEIKEMVSIILPAYNRADTIIRSIQSVLQQTYPWFELLVIDDGSTDETEDLVKGIRDKRILYLKNMKNEGAAKSRNIGIEHARYPYVAFQDSDDCWAKDKLEKQMRALAENPGAGFVYCSYFYHSVDGSYDRVFPGVEIPLEKKRGNIFRELLIHNLAGTPVLLVKKECFIEAGMFQENLKCLEDYELVLRLAQKFDAVFVDEVLLDAYASIASVTNNAAEDLAARCYIVGIYKKELLGFGLFDSVVRNILENARNLGCLEEIIFHLEKILTK